MAEKTIAEDAAADAKSYLDSIVTTLSVPVPLLLGVSIASYARASKPPTTDTTTVSVSGVDVPFALAVVLAMVLIDVLLLHVSRMVFMLRDLWGNQPTREATRKALLHNAGMLNPFAGSASFRAGVGLVGTVVSFTPKLAVGVLIGIYAMFALMVGDFGGDEAFGSYFGIIAMAITLLHTIASGAAIVSIIWMNMDLGGLRSCTSYFVGLIAGLVLGYVVSQHVGAAL